MFQNGFFLSILENESSNMKLQNIRNIYIINSFLWQGTWYLHCFFPALQKIPFLYFDFFIESGLFLPFLYLLAHIWLNMLITWLYLMKGSVFGCFRFPTEHTDGQGGSWQMQVHPFLFLLLFQSKLWNHSNPFKIN